MKRIIAIIGPTLMATAAYGFVNPQLQPYHLFERFRHTVGAEVTKVDEENRRVTLKITATFIGRFESETLTVDVPAAEGEQSDPFPMGGFGEGGDLIDEVRVGDVAVACLVGKGRRTTDSGKLYVAGGWHELNAAEGGDASRWTWATKYGDEMVGTYTGRAEGLYAMAADAAAGRLYFPARPTVKFREAAELTRYESPIFGVALVDIDGDGRLDAYACNPKEGNRALLARPDGTYRDATKRLGLHGVQSRSCSFADVDFDGRVDLLAGDTLLLNRKEGFVRTTRLDTGGQVICSAFVEIDGDGRPDAVFSVRNGGLRFARYDAEAESGALVEIPPQTLGFGTEQTGAGMTFFFAPGDWNGDGRTDLFLAFGKGTLLTQSKSGRFRVVEGRLNCRFAVANETPIEQTGGGCFVPILADGDMDLVAAGDAALHIIANHDGMPQNITASGNESRLTHGDHRATLGEDLNVDGTVDLFTISNGVRGEHAFHNNRGYGSFMFSELYVDYAAFPGQAFKVGAGGVSAGDVNDDGAPDLLLGGVDGVLRLTLNDTLSRRKAIDHPSHNERKLLQTQILTVTVEGPRGVTGATVKLIDSGDRVVHLRQIGTAVLTGCARPNALNLAVREPGRYRLQVRYGDGHTVQREIDVTASAERRRTRLKMKR